MIIELPDELDAIRHRINYRDDKKVYITVSLYNNEPIEVFCKFNESETPENFYKHAAWNAITRLTSMLLRSGMELKDVITQLDRSSIYPKDMPGTLAKVLKEYLGEDEQENEEESIE